MSSLSRSRVPLDDIQFCAWIAQARPGDRLEYHRGMLALDASVHGQSLATGARLKLARVARRAWSAAGEGLVHLVQRRNGPDDFTYIAIARPRTAETSVSLSSIILKEIAQ